MRAAAQSRGALRVCDNIGQIIFTFGGKDRSDKHNQHKTKTANKSKQYAKPAIKAAKSNAFQTRG